MSHTTKQRKMEQIGNLNTTGSVLTMSISKTLNMTIVIEESNWMFLKEKKQKHV